MLSIWNNLGLNKSGVIHVNWDVVVSESDIDELVNLARSLPQNKARLCLHETSSSPMQVTYLAFVDPYADKVHKHPVRPEVIIPVRGEAIRQIYSDNFQLIDEVQMISGRGESFSMPPNKWHSLEVRSENFVMIEIGLGPFTSDSTINR